MNLSLCKPKFKAIQLLFITVFCSSTIAYGAAQLNGFDLGSTLIPVTEILRGGPPKDGIPALDNPLFIEAAKSLHLKKDDTVIGIYHKGIAKAYPLRILNYHEIVNDRFGDTAVTVTYCPLCGSGMVFDSQINGSELKFGVSGLLYNSDVLLYDTATQSLWSQILMQAVSGEMMGENLQIIPSQQTTWKSWKKLYPQTIVQSFNTGHSRDYERSPYSGYELSSQTMFPVQFDARGYHAKEWVIAIEINGVARAWPFSQLRKTTSPIQDMAGNQELLVYFDTDNASARITDLDGELLPATTLFWFAWSAFHPETTIFSADDAIN